jgi:hypothetical protein
VTGNLVRPAPGTFAAQSTTPYASGSGLEWVKVADLNNDGHPDLLTANFLSNDVSVLLSNGSGGFAAAVPYAVGTGPYTVDTGDLNGDGRLDLVAANTNSANFSVRLGLPGGTFGPKDRRARRPQPDRRRDREGRRGLAARRGHLELRGEHGVRVPGQWVGWIRRPPRATPPARTRTGSRLATSTTTAGRILVTANYTANNVSVLLGTVSGFAAKTDFAAGSAPLTLALGDLNGDGKLDAVTANSGASTVAVLLGNGLGGFAAPVPYAVPAAPVTVKLADANGDGLIDVIVCCDLSNSVSILANNGAGVLAAPVTFPVGTTPYGVALADVTGDGHPDLVSANFGSNNVTVVAGNVTVPTVFCPPFTNTMTGRIALLDRGSCAFGPKILAAQNAGAVGAVVVNDVPGVTAMAVAGGATIPAFMVQTTDGAAMKDALRTGPVRVKLESITSVRTDGTIDNTVVAHEWGHYLSHRLAGSLANQQGGAMGEGWGDFVSLLLTARPEDAKLDRCVPDRRLRGAQLGDAGQRVLLSGTGVIRIRRTSRRTRSRSSTSHKGRPCRWDPRWRWRPPTIPKCTVPARSGVQRSGSATPRSSATPRG